MRTSVDVGLTWKEDPLEINEFFDRFVDGYLLGDLRTMAEIKTEPPFGGVGYPMMATTLAGTELLGGLLLPRSTPAAKTPAKRGNQNFMHYWNHYFVEENQIYQGLGMLFRQLVRHGIVHSFVAKHNVWIERGTFKPVSIYSQKKGLFVDCILFYRDFESSYLARVRPIVDGTSVSARTTKSEMQQRLASLEREDEETSGKAFGKLHDLHASLVNGDRMRVQVRPPLDNDILKQGSLGLSSRPTGPSGGTGGTGPSGPTGPV
jgi:hypothetical protein